MINNSAPLLLTAYADVYPGKSAILDSDKLRSPSGDPFEVIGFRINAEFSSPDGSGVVCPSVRARIKLGQYDLIKGFVPIWLLNNPASYDGDIGVSFRLHDDGTTLLSHRLQLEKTFIVGPGDAFVVDLERELNDDLSAGDPNAFIRVWFTVIARYFKPGSSVKKRWNEIPLIIPWIGNAVADQFSLEALKNPLLKPLWIERIIGRLEYNPGRNSGSKDSIGHATVMDMIDSMGYAMVPRNTPFNNVFIPGPRDWVFHRELEPNGFYSMHVRTNSTDIRPMVALFGYRKEPMP